MAVASISVEALKEKLDRGEPFILLDVREVEEFLLANLGGTHLPLGELPERFRELDPEAEIVCLCHHGVRSLHAAHFLQAQGFPRVLNVTGGIDAWSVKVDPAVRRY